MTSKKPVSTNSAPQAIGPYSQAVLCDGWLYCSGQVALDPNSGVMIEGGVQAQARQALENLAAVLEEGGCTFSDVVKVSVFLKDLEDFGVVNEIYGQFFSAPYPARACVEVSRLPKDALVELDCVAKLPS